MTEQNDVVLQCDVGAPSAATTTAAAAAATATAEATAASTGKRTAATVRRDAAAARPMLAMLARPRAMRSRRPARRHVHGRTATTAAAAIGGLRAITATLGPGLGAISAATLGAIATALGTIRRARPIATAIPGTIAAAVPCPIACAIAAPPGRSCPGRSTCCPSRPRKSIRFAAPAFRLLLPKRC